MEHYAFLFLLAEEIVAQEGDDEVRGDELAFLVDEGDAVGVAVEQQSDVAFVLLHQFFYLLLVLSLQRVRLVAREASVESVINIIRSVAEQPFYEDVRRSIAAVDGDSQVVDVTEELALELHIFRIEVDLADGAAFLHWLWLDVRFHELLELVESGVVAHWLGVFGADLHAVMIRRVV